MHETPVQDRSWRDDQESTGSSHSHRIHIRGRPKVSLDKELPRTPQGDSYGGHKDYFSRSAKNQVHLDGTASLGSSQSRLIRSVSPTPSVASSLSINAPKSPGEIPKSRLWGRFGGLGGLVGRRDKTHDKDSEGNGSRRLRSKASEPMLNTNGGPPISAGKRGSAGSEHHTRNYDYMYAETKKGKGVDPKRAGRSKKHGGFQPAEEEHLPLAIDMDFSKEETFRNLSAGAVPTDKPWLPEEPPEQKVSWQAPESWDTLKVKAGEAPETEQEPEEDEGKEDAQVCTLPNFDTTGTNAYCISSIAYESSEPIPLSRLCLAPCRLPSKRS